MRSEALKQLWDEWELRLLVMVSLTVQILLSLFATHRNRGMCTLTNGVLWLAYLLADYVATLALGILARGEGEVLKDASRHYLVNLWAPFFLLHLGGPDAITAFSMEDNELWLRHGLSLAVEVVVAVYVCVRSRQHQFHLIIPMVLIFLAGTCKYLERTLALRRGSMDGLRRSLVSKPNAGPDYASTMDRYAAKLRSGQPAPINVDEEAKRKSGGEPKSTPAEEGSSSSAALPNTTLLCTAHEFFPKFRGLFVDAIFSFKDRGTSRTFFIGISPQNASQAFNVIAFELNFAYEMLYTKANVSRTALGYVIRVLSTLFAAFALSLFFVAQKEGLDRFDVYCTYALLGAAFVLELVGISRLFLSDWTVVDLSRIDPDSRKSTAWKCLLGTIIQFHPLDNPRWSDSMDQYNLLSFCLKDRRPSLFKFTFNLLGVKHIWNNWRHTTRIPVMGELKQIIFEELKEKSNLAEKQNDYMRFTICRGEYTLKEYHHTDLVWSIEPEFDESLLIWHIATDLYIASSEFITEQDLTEELKKKLQMAKTLANYLLYILVTRPLMLSSIAVIGVTRYEDTCAEVQAFLKGEKRVSDVKEACRMLLSVNTDLRPRTVKGDESKSVLWDGCILAKQLVLIEDKEKGADLICKVWVEMLCFAAINCRGQHHAERLKEGGELLTFVWFLMSHLGLGKIYRIESGTNTVNLVTVE